MKCALLILALVACGSKKRDDKPRRDDAAISVDATVTLPPAPPLPDVPAGLPAPPEHPDVTPEYVALGELLFWDTRLSRTNALSCASCHIPREGYSAAEPQPNANDKLNLRRAQPLVNLAWQKDFGWDGRYASLAEHLAAHVRGQLGDDLASAVARIADVPGYRAHFARVGGPRQGATSHADAAVTALSAYLVTRYAGNAPWDRLERAPDVPADMKAGYVLFTGKAQCSVCHPPPLYTDQQFHRLGLIAVADEGRGRVDAAQKGAFKTPTLRGAAMRTGFFHDGSAKSLDAAIDWHLAGGTGQGADASIVDPALRKITLSPQERANLGAFVRALSDMLAPSPQPTLP